MNNTNEFVCFVGSIFKVFHTPLKRRHNITNNKFSNLYDFGNDDILKTLEKHGNRTSELVETD